MYALYLETSAPTAVDHCAVGGILDRTGEQLVTVSVNTLRVYRLNPYCIVVDGSGSTGLEQSTKLECVLTLHLPCPVRSLAAAAPAGRPRDWLLLAFDDAKLSVLEYDPLTHELACVSMHAYEEEILRGGLCREPPASPQVVCDPESRCAAMSVFGRHLAVVPLGKSPLAELLDEPQTPAAALVESSNKPMLFSYLVPFKELDEHLCNVLDMAFLHGYHEPTLLFLYEPIPTTVGRLAIRTDTCQILAVSINARDRVHAAIWSVPMLPFDCTRVLAVPKPVSGVIVFAVNSVLYLNQSVPSTGISLNGCYGDLSAFPFRDRSSLRIALDAAQFTLSRPPGQVTVVTRHGKVHVLDLLLDDRKVVKGLEMSDSAFVTSAPCSMCAISSSVGGVYDSFVFIGSRLGDSVLLKMMPKGTLPPIKTVLLQAIMNGCWCAQFDGGVVSLPNGDGENAPPAPQDDVDLYGEPVTIAAASAATVALCEYKESDTLLHMGPCRYLCIGAPGSVPDPLRQYKLDPLFDLVFASGHGHTAGICAVHRSVRPSIVTSSVIARATQLWTLGRRPRRLESMEDETVEDGGGGSPQQRYLLVSKDVTTMVLELGDEIAELETDGFVIEQKTIAAGNFFGGEFIVQVCPMAVVLVRDGDQRVQYVPLDIPFPVCYASICDPFVALLTENGHVHLLEFVYDGSRGELQLSFPAELNGVSANALCVFRDDSGLFDLAAEEQPQPLAGRRQTSVQQLAQRAQTGAPLPMDETSQSAIDVDDEDVLLYGDADGAGASDKKEEAKPMHVGADDESRFALGGCVLHDPNTVMPTFWLFVANAHGLLEVYSLPGLQCVYTVRKFPWAHRTLFDADTVSLSLMGAGVAAASSTSAGEPVAQADKDAASAVKEIACVGMGANGARPHLFAVIGDELYVYEVFACIGSAAANRLGVRFSRLSRADGGVLVLRNTKIAAAVAAKTRKRQLGDEGGLSGAAAASAGGAALAASDELIHYARLLHPWDGLGAYEHGGLFVAGPYPYWIFAGAGRLHVHPMNFDGPVTSFSAFNNPNCAKGFLYLTGEPAAASVHGARPMGTMRVCTLQEKVAYDATMPVWRTPLRKTVTHVCYLLDSHTYAVSTATPVTHRRVGAMVGDEKQFDTIDRPPDTTFIDATVDKYHLELYSPETWEPVAGAGTVDFVEYESVLVMKEVALASESTMTGLQNYLAVGTGINYGEEVIIRGRIFILEIIEVVPEPGQPKTKHRLKTVLEREEKGPVSSLCALNGYLLMGVAQKIYIWSWKDNDLQGISFIDLHFYAHQMVSVRSLAVIADVYRSLSIVRYQEKDKCLSVAARDMRPMPIQAMTMTVDFMVDNRTLAFLMSDEDGNLVFFTHQPECKESLGGTRLIQRGDIYIGQRVASLARVQGHVSDAAVDNKLQAASRHVNVFGTLDGATGLLLPVAEKQYRRLYTLQQTLAGHLKQAAGLHPRAARSSRGYRATQCGPGAGAHSSARNVLDGDLLYRYLDLSVAERADLAKRLGTSRHQLTDDLLEIDRITTNF